jgi:hypothetical protein
MQLIPREIRKTQIKNRPWIITRGDFFQISPTFISRTALSPVQTAPKMNMAE